MTSLNTHYKVSTVAPAKTGTNESPQKAATTAAPADQFEAAKANSYQSLVSGGSAKAECINGGVISEMAQADNQVQYAKPTHYNGIQAILSDLSVGNVRECGPCDTHGDIPSVPDLEQDILKRTYNFNNMEPIVRKYQALEKTLTAMAITAEKGLSPSNMSTMTANEYEDLRSYLKEIQSRLATCRKELIKSKDLYQDQLVREAEKAEKAKAEEEAYLQQNSV